MKRKVFPYGCQGVLSSMKDWLGEVNMMRGEKEEAANKPPRPLEPQIAAHLARLRKN